MTGVDETSVVALFTSSFQFLNPFDEIDEDLMKELNDC